MERRPYSVDPLTGTAHYVDYDASDDALHYTSEQEVAPLLEWNRLMYNAAPTRWGEGQHVAHLPAIIVVKLMQEGILYDSKKLRRFLNDYDFRALRTRPGNL